MKTPSSEWSLEFQWRKIHPDRLLFLLSFRCKSHLQMEGVLGSQHRVLALQHMLELKTPKASTALGQKGTSNGTAWSDKDIR
jgi:hypothetical protein